MLPSASTLPTFLDLFCGCGGFTLGLQRAGFECLAAIDFNAEAVATLRANLQAKSPTGLKPVGFALEADLTTLFTSLNSEASREDVEEKHDAPVPVPALASCYARSGCRVSTSSTDPSLI